MDNKVGDNPFDAATSAQLLATLQGVVAELKKRGLTLSTVQRKAILHARLGAEPHIQRVHDLAVKYKVDIDSIPLQGMQNDLLFYTQLRPFQDELHAAVILADDTAGQAESEAWEAFLAYYGTLCGMAKHQAALAAELQPVIDFMATGPRKKAAEPAPGGGGAGGGGSGGG